MNFNTRLWPFQFEGIYHSPNRSLFETFWFLYTMLFCFVVWTCLNPGIARMKTNKPNQIYFSAIWSNGERLLILERNKPGSLRGINFAITNNIVQPRCFPWRPAFCLRCGIFSNLAFDDPFKQNLPKNAEWTSIKFAVVICSSPHISQYSQSITR